LAWGESDAPRICDSLDGWFTVDNVVYEGEILTELDLRFEQRCKGGGASLFGKIHWLANDDSPKISPINPIPTDLWEPPPGAIPLSGNYVYLESQPGDFIGGGGTYLHTDADSTFSVSTKQSYVDTHSDVIDLKVTGGVDWQGEFTPMSSLNNLEPGYYPGVTRYPFHDPLKGGLVWSGGGRLCNTLEGWIAVDNITYQDNLPTSIDLRFEQHCEGFIPALNGKIHWEAQ